jgi:hypothetical protein
MGLTAILYITAVLVSMMFERQERRHRFELELEYERLGKILPPPKPRLSAPTSWLNVIVGTVMGIMGVPMLLSQFAVLRLSSHLTKPHDAMMGAQFEMSAVWLATSIALILLGLKSVRQHRRLAKGSANT